MAKKQKDEKEIPFEDALVRLENIVEELENEDTPLEQSVKLFEEGKNLSTLCMKRLTEIEKKIQVLIDKGDEVRYEEFVTMNEDEPDQESE